MIKCSHAKNGLCEVSTKLANIDVPLAEDACLACVNHDPAQSINHVTASKAIYVLRKQNLEVPIHLYKHIKPIENKGPGTELSKLISWFKAITDSKCKCNKRVRKMNQWGPDECERRRPTIRRWLRHSAHTYKVPYNSTVADSLITRAIKNARAKMGSSSSNST
jgi:hypothetical protein